MIPHSSRLASLGFFNFENENRWSFLLFTWLPRFDPLLFLTRRINSEAPTGSAKAPWVQCVKALTNDLIEQTDSETNLLKDAQGRIRSNRQYDQLVIIPGCLTGVNLIQG